jgi:hypothetical protein
MYHHDDAKSAKGSATETLARAIERHAGSAGDHEPAKSDHASEHRHGIGGTFLIRFLALYPRTKQRIR